MSTSGTITRRTLISGVNNPAYQVSKNVWNESLVITSAAADGSVLVRDSAQADGWGFQSKQYLDVKRDYGAVGDGLVNDSVAIRNALAEISSRGGGILLFAKGVYLVSQDGSNGWCIDVPSNVMLLGEAEATLKMAAATPNGVRILVISSKTNVTVRDLTLDGNYTNQTGTIDQQYAVLVNDCTDVLFEHSKFLNTGGDGILIMGATGLCDRITVRGCVFNANQRNGITLYDGFRNVDILDNYFGTRFAAAIDSEPVAYVADSIGNVRVRGNFVLYQAGCTALDVGARAEGDLTHHWIITDNDLGGTVHITGGDYITVVNNRIIGTVDAGVIARFGGSWNDISHNQIEVDGLPGVFLLWGLDDGPDQISIVGNQIRQAGNAEGIISRGANNVLIADNLIISDVGYNVGIRLWATVSMLSQIVRGNIVKHFSTGMLAERSGSSTITGLVITDNIFDDDPASLAQYNAITIASGADFVTDLVISGNVTSPAGITPLVINDATNYVESGQTRGIGHWVGSGTPEGVVTADIGSSYRQRDGGGAIWDKRSGSGNTGWFTPTGGTVTNDNAAAGHIGEYIEDQLFSGTPVSLTTNVVVDVASIDLTAGDWDVSGFIGFNFFNGSGVITHHGGSSPTSATFASEGSSIVIPLESTAGYSTSTLAVTIPLLRYSLASTTTVYLVAKGTFASGTAECFGRISARRMR